MPFNFKKKMLTKGINGKKKLWGKRHLTKKSRFPDFPRFFGTLNLNRR